MQNVLKQQFTIRGLQAPVLGEELRMEVQLGEFLQILCVNSNYWICVSTIDCPSSTIHVDDSMHGRLHTRTQKLVADLMQSKDRGIEVHNRNVQRQSALVTVASLLYHCHKCLSGGRS